MFTLTALLLIHFPSPVFEGQWFHVIIMCVHYAVPYLHPQAVSPHPLLFVLIYISLLQNGVKTCTTTSCIAMLLIITSHVIFLRRKQHPLTEIIKWISVYWHDKHVWRSCTALTHGLQQICRFKHGIFFVCIRSLQHARVHMQEAEYPKYNNILFFLLLLAVLINSDWGD